MQGERNHPLHDKPDPAGWAFSSLTAEAAGGKRPQCSGQGEKPGNIFSRVGQAGRHRTPKQVTLRVQACGPPLPWVLSLPAAWGGTGLAGPGRCLRQGARSTCPEEHLSPSVG